MRAGRPCGERKLHMSDTIHPNSAAANGSSSNGSGRGKNNLEGVINSSLANLRELVDVDTIIGTPIETADATIIPVSKVTFGFTSGGSDIPSAKQAGLFGGGSGGGVTIQPLAFIVVSQGEVKIMNIPVASVTPVDRAVEMLPDVVDKISALLAKKDKADKAREAAAKREEAAKTE